MHTFFCPSFFLHPHALPLSPTCVPTLGPRAPPPPPAPPPHTHSAPPPPTLPRRISVEEGAGNRRHLALRLVPRSELPPSELAH